MRGILFQVFFLSLLLLSSPLRAQQVPPEFPVRTMAEWEEVEYLVVAWNQYQTVLREIVRYGREECKVIVVCRDSLHVKRFLKWGNVPLSNIIFIESPVNSVWVRDYAATSVYSGEVDSLLQVEWIYNRPRPYDDQIPIKISEFLNIPLYTTKDPPFDLVHTGGNFMTDGMGTAFSSRLVLSENSAAGNFNPSIKNEVDIDHLMFRFMGIDRYIKMPVLPYDGIHHIDMHMKLLDEETLLVGEYPEGIADGPQIENNLHELMGTYSNGFGFPYDIVRIPMPPHKGFYPDTWWANYRTYTNAVFVNRTVLVPVYEEKYDTTALRIMRENLPGYRVVGINCNEIIKSGGALHCITQTVGVKDPLLIRHRKLRDTYSSGFPHQINAYIQHKTGILRASIFYSTDSTLNFQEIPLEETLPEKGIWTGSIPPQPQGTKIYYYIRAISRSGKVMTRPMTAPKGYWKFSIIPPGENAYRQNWFLR